MVSQAKSRQAGGVQRLGAQEPCGPKHRCCTHCLSSPSENIATAFYLQQLDKHTPVMFAAALQGG